MIRAQLQLPWARFSTVVSFHSSLKDNQAQCRKDGRNGAECAIMNYRRVSRPHPPCFFLPGNPRKSLDLTFMAFRKFTAKTTAECGPRGPESFFSEEEPTLVGPNNECSLCQIAGVVFTSSSVRLMRGHPERVFLTRGGVHRTASQI